MSFLLNLIFLFSAFCLNKIAPSEIAFRFVIFAFAGLLHGSSLSLISYVVVVSRLGGGGDLALKWNIFYV